MVKTGGINVAPSKSRKAYKVRRLIRFAAETELPLTTTGKLQKNRLASKFFHFES